MKTKHIFFLILFIAPVLINAQNTLSIEGVIYDEKKEPLAYATVQLLTKDSAILTSIPSDIKGFYQISNQYTNAAILKVSYIGYSNYYTIITPMVSHKLDIQLRSDSKNLSTVQVVAEKNAIQNSIDKIVLNADKLAVAAGGNATDVLRSAPAVTVDMEGNVALRGNKNVAILINGQPAERFGGDVTRLLQSMNASEIQSVEIINNPGAKYRAEGTAGVINIVTKKKKNNGWRGSVEAFVSANPDANGNAQLGYSNELFDMNAAYSTRYFNGQNNRDYSTYINDVDTNYVYESTLKGKNKDFNNNANINLGFNIDSNNRLDIGGWLFNFNGDQPNSIYNTFYQGSSPYLITQGNTKVNWSGTFWGAYINHTHTFKRQSTLSTQAFYSRGEFKGGSESIEDILTYKSLPNFGLKVNNREGGNDMSLSMDYMLPINENAVFEAGFVSDNDFNLNESYRYDMNSDSSFIPFPNYMTQWEYRLHVNGAYVSFSNAYEGLQYKLGLRAEHTLYNGIFSKASGNIDGSYLNIFPTIHLNYNTKKGASYTLSYSRRIDRPETWQLSPWVFTGDTRIRELGNPDLKPVITNSFDLSYLKTYNKGSINAAIYYRLIQNTFINLFTANADGITTSRLSNAAMAHQIGFDIFLQWKPTKWFSTTLNINPRYEKIDENRNLNYKYLSYWNTSSNIILQFNPFTWWLIQTQYDYTPKQRNLQGLTKSNHGLDIAMRWKVYKNNVAITLKCTDVFYTRRFAGYTQTYNTYQVFNNKFQSRILSLGITYRFGMGQRTREENLLRDVNRNTGRGVR